MRKWKCTPRTEMLSKESYTSTSTSPPPVASRPSIAPGRSSADGCARSAERRLLLFPSSVRRYTITGACIYFSWDRRYTGDGFEHSLYRMLLFIRGRPCRLLEGTDPNMSSLLKHMNPNMNDSTKHKTI